jgi:hypothetical protein
VAACVARSERSAQLGIPLKSCGGAGDLIQINESTPITLSIV